MKQNLGNAAFFTIKGLKKELEELKLRVKEIEGKEQVRGADTQRTETGQSQG